MLLIISNKTDLATDFLILRMHEKGIPFFRINTEDFLSDWDVNFHLGDGKSNFYIQQKSGRNILGETISGAYIRQPRLPSLDIVKDDQVFAEREIGETLRSLWRFIKDEIWLNAPHNIIRASNKPEQLLIAQKLGFLIPTTCITCDKELILKFFNDNDKSIIAKAVKHGFLYEGGQAKVATTQLLDKDCIDELDQYARLPMIFQRHIRKNYDIRVTVVGDKVFAAAIYSQEHDKTKIDWRLSDYHKIELRHEAIELPSNISRLCALITNRLNLRYAAIDLILSEDGNYYFLEVNPNGQWAWIEQTIGYPIRDAIIERLVK